MKKTVWILVWVLILVLIYIFGYKPYSSMQWWNVLLDTPSTWLQNTWQKLQWWTVSGIPK